MAYIIETFDKPDRLQVRMRVRPQHMAYLEANKDKLLACGAKLDEAGQRPTGSLYLIKVDTFAEAEKFITDDPFNEADLFEHVYITRWRATFFNGVNMLRGRQGGGGAGRGDATGIAGHGHLDQP